MKTEKNNHQERLIASYILCAAGFLGFGGLHRLYNGKIGTGLLWFFTLGFFYVGQFVDLLLIPGMIDEYEQNLRLKAGLSPLGLPVNQPVVNTQVYQPTGHKLMLKLLEAAASRGGFLTVTQGVMATGASFAEVEMVLKDMLQSGYVIMDNDPVTGAVTYHFHEM
ncbi:NINE protein [Okeanomitos corallinicola TIOX110]|uniref:NINE protein n=1 Tax=Okeanomitos corallinicola TIOX110 TaxID=3133117 RepID=A0ABZ2V277_9CYAN